MLALALALVLAGPQAAAATDWLGLRTLNIAHQGGENEVPSNTMYSYARARRLGADMLEVDVHTTADGELVVLHDATVDRTTNGTGRVYDLTLAQVQALDAGHNLVPGEGTEAGGAPESYPFRGVRTGERKPPAGFRPDDFRIPTLDEVMDAYPRVPINIEIKGAADSDVASFTRNAEALAASLNSRGRSEGIMVASFNDAALARFHELAPSIDLAPATGAVAGYVAARLPPPEGTKAFQVPLDFGGITVVDQSFVDRAHADGYGVHVWTINDEPTMRQLLDWGVEGIMTAEPMRLERVLCHAAVARPPRPPGAPGTHCAKRASIACDVVATEAGRRGERLRVELRRADEFAGRCAGKFTIRPADAPGRASARFNFGDEPPSAGGRRSITVSTRLRGLAEALVAGAEVRSTTRPYGAFPRRARLRVR